jgi:hypothetical protein
VEIRCGRQNGRIGGFAGGWGFGGGIPGEIIPTEMRNDLERFVKIDQRMRNRSTL